MITLTFIKYTFSNVNHCIYIYVLYHVYNENLLYIIIILSLLTQKKLMDAQCN